AWPSIGKAWFFFIAKNGQRQQWVFGQGCNSSSRPITVTYDTDDPSNGGGASNTLYKNSIQQVHNEWNQDPSLNLNLINDINTVSTDITYFEMTPSSVNSFLSNPTPGVIRVVWDSDASILTNLGVDKEAVLGVGLPLAIDSSRPNEICSGILILNGWLINTAGGNAQKFYRYTLMHEIGHVFGFAHSIAGDNGTGALVDASSDYVPVMHPFVPDPLSLTKTLTDDEKAGLITVYGQ
ncbi:MAG: hypothetical protein KDK37_02545, partial [Leptospiraceae bacterium]|nr:hypothetical protein [Leptospiraceae bacterium]